MTSALERRAQPQGNDFIREPKGHNASAHRQDVGVVVLPGKPRREEVVAERGADTAHFIGGNLFSLSASPEHDASLGASLDDSSSHRGADGWVIYRGLAVGAEVFHVMAESRQGLHQVLF